MSITTIKVSYLGQSILFNLGFCFAKFSSEYVLILVTLNSLLVTY